MKEITSIKFECTDGTRYESKEKAMLHEFRLTAESDLGDDAKRLTATSLIEIMFSDPAKYMHLLNPDA